MQLVPGEIGKSLGVCTETGAQGKSDLVSPRGRLRGNTHLGVHTPSRVVGSTLSPSAVLPPLHLPVDVGHTPIFSGMSREQWTGRSILQF